MVNKMNLRTNEQVNYMMFLIYVVETWSLNTKT